jgi:hypothetical protein
VSRGPWSDAYATGVRHGAKRQRHQASRTPTGAGGGSTNRPLKTKDPKLVGDRFRKPLERNPERGAMSVADLNKILGAGGTAALLPGTGEDG